MIHILILLLFCHFLADFTSLSRPSMLRAKSVGKPIFPIILHGSIHALLMFIVAIIFSNFKIAVVIFMIQLITHSLIDILKGLINTSSDKFRSINNVSYWMLFGFDQFLHQLIIIYIFNIIIS